MLAAGECCMLGADVCAVLSIDVIPNSDHPGPATSESECPAYGFQPSTCLCGFIDEAIHSGTGWRMFLLLRLVALTGVAPSECLAGRVIPLAGWRRWRLGRDLGSSQWLCVGALFQFTYNRNGSVLQRTNMIRRVGQEEPDAPKQGNGSQAGGS